MRSAEMTGMLSSQRTWRAWEGQEYELYDLNERPNAGKTIKLDCAVQICIEQKSECLLASNVVNGLFSALMASHVTV